MLVGMCSFLLINRCYVLNTNQPTHIVIEKGPFRLICHQVMGAESHQLDPGNETCTNTRMWIVNPSCSGELLNRIHRIKAKWGTFEPLYLLRFKNAVLVFSLKRSTGGALRIPLRVLSQKDMTGDKWVIDACQDGWKFLFCLFMDLLGKKKNSSHPHKTGSWCLIICFHWSREGSITILVSQSLVVLIYSCM